MNKIATIAFSGGMDSTSLLLHLLKNHYKVYALSFNYGQKHKLEIKKATQNIKYLKSKNYIVNHKIINIQDCMDILSSSLTNISEKVPEGFYEDESMKNTFVPNRNAIFTSILYGYALTLSKQNNSKKIIISLGVHSGDHTIYPDCRKEFYVQLFKSFKLGNWDSEKIDFYLPYLNYTKSQILNDANSSTQKLNLDFNLVFKNTLTSYAPDNKGRSNGKTGADIERILAFNDNNLIDPIKYTKPWEKILKEALQIEKKFKSINQS